MVQTIVQYTEYLIEERRLALPSLYANKTWLTCRYVTCRRAFLDGLDDLSDLLKSIQGEAGTLNEVCHCP